MYLENLGLIYKISANYFSFCRGFVEVSAFFAESKKIVSEAGPELSLFRFSGVDFTKGFWAWSNVFASLGSAEWR